MKKVYINSAVSISAQNTFEDDAFLRSAKILTKEKTNAIYPDFREFIAVSSLRRMATGVKMGVTAAKKALIGANIEMPDAILTGTGMGCIEDTEKFLNTLIKNNEAYLTPTPFIQSTHNTVGGTIALALQCKGYNNTFTNGAVSFESALLDAKMGIDEGLNNILIGGVDELGLEFIDYLNLIEEQKDKPLKVSLGEGAQFFVISSKKEKAVVEVLDVIIFGKISEENIEKELKNFLKENEISEAEIDATILGKNGDGFDVYYEILQNGLFSETQQLHYKHLCGEYFTASSFGFWAGIQILKTRTIPEILKLNSDVKNNYKTILLYNQFKGENHSFILLRRC